MPLQTQQPTARCRGDDGFSGSVEMLFVWVISIGLFLFIFELAAYWHVRNTLEQAGAEGARTAALYNGDCTQAINAATANTAIDVFMVVSSNGMTSRDDSGAARLC